LIHISQHNDLPKNRIIYLTKFLQNSFSANLICECDDILANSWWPLFQRLVYQDDNSDCYGACHKIVRQTPQVKIVFSHESRMNHAAVHVISTDDAIPTVIFSPRGYAGPQLRSGIIRFRRVFRSLAGAVNSRISRERSSLHNALDEPLIRLTAEIVSTAYPIWNGRIFNQVESVTKNRIKSNIHMISKIETFFFSLKKYSLLIRKFQSLQYLFDIRFNISKLI